MIYEDMACESTQTISVWDSCDNEPKTEDGKIVTISNVFKSSASRNHLSLSPLLLLGRKSISIEKRAGFWTDLQNSIDNRHNRQPKNPEVSNDQNNENNKKQ
ncbi:hypothetical protein N9Y92_04300 [Chlamydiales bacterium]|nr:hypothetical protein [Chlamydiales bacterium]